MLLVALRLFAGPAIWTGHASGGTEPDHSSRSGPGEGSPDSTFKRLAVGKFMRIDQDMYLSFPPNAEENVVTDSLSTRPSIGRSGNSVRWAYQPA